MTPPAQDSPPRFSPSVLGVDGGGTRTRVARIENGVITREVDGEATNPLTVGLDTATARLVALLERASGGASTDAIGIGIAGVGASSDARDRFSAAVSEHFPEAAVCVTTDVVCALAGAFAGGPGILVVGGTGSVAIGFAEESCYRAGGWGRRLGDQGSGFDLFRKAVQVALGQEDGLDEDWPPSERLAGAIVRKLSLCSTGDLIALFAKDPDSEQLLLAVEAIVEEARDGDALARALLEAQGRELARLAIAVAKRLDAVLPVSTVPVSTIGGLLRGAELVRASFDASIADYGLEVREPLFPAEVGAANLAASIVNGDAYRGLLEASGRLLR